MRRTVFFVFSLGAAALCIAPTTVFAARITGGGRVPSVMTVGRVYTSHLWFKNNGKPVAHPVLDLSGMTDHSVLDHVWTNYGRGQKSSHGDYWRFGKWKHGATLRITLVFAPRDSGNHTLDVVLWDGWDSPYGIPTGEQLDSLSADIPINP